MPETSKSSFHRDGLRGWELRRQQICNQMIIPRIAWTSWPCVYSPGLWESESITAEVASELGFEGKRAMGQWIEKD